MPSDEITKHVDKFIKARRTLNYTFSDAQVNQFKQSLHDS